MSEICGSIHQMFNDLPRFTFPFDTKRIPRNGIYILFEKGEVAHDDDRIVRVGTHTGKNQLPSRLRQHFLKENKDWSIFRKNIGRALLNKANDPFLEMWEIDLTTGNAKREYAGMIDMDKLKQTEKLVSAHIQNNFSFVVFQVDDKEQRMDLESKIISTVSWCEECGPSGGWLGLFSPKAKIRESGLWLVNELWKKPLRDLEILESLVEGKREGR